MSAAEIIEQIEKLPLEERASVIDWLVSGDEDDAILAAFDRIPRGTRLTEEEILALPRRVDSAG